MQVRKETTAIYNSLETAAEQAISNGHFELYTPAPNPLMISLLIPVNPCPEVLPEWAIQPVYPHITVLDVMSRSNGTTLPIDAIISALSFLDEGGFGAVDFDGVLARADSVLAKGFQDGWLTKLRAVGRRVLYEAGFSRSPRKTSAERYILEYPAHHTVLRYSARPPVQQLRSICSSLSKTYTFSFDVSKVCLTAGDYQQMGPLAVHKEWSSEDDRFI